MATKKTISDAVLYKLAGGVPDASFPVHERDVWAAIENKMNALFKIRHFDVTLKGGDTIPDGLSIGVYEDVTVTSDGEKSYALLPVTPISLPRNQGVLLVYDPDNPDFPFIPLQRGQRALLRTDALLSDMLNQVSYDVINRKIIFSKDLTTLDCTAVTMELVVFDMSLYGKTDTLPIPADFEDELERQLIEEFAPVVPDSGYVNIWSNKTDKPQQ